MHSITVDELSRWQAEGRDFELLDVRREGVRTTQGAEIAGSHWHDPARWLDWKDCIAAERPVVVYCAKGHEIGQGLTTTLRVLGVDAVFLQGGMQGWLEAGRDVAPIDVDGARP